MDGSQQLRLQRLAHHLVPALAAADDVDEVEAAVDVLAPPADPAGERVVAAPSL
jgi:hypothetical protein